MSFCSSCGTPKKGEPICDICGQVFETVAKPKQITDEFSAGNSITDIPAKPLTNQDGTYQPPQGSYQQPPQGSYQQPPQGSYQQPPQGSYQQPPQGSYQQPQQGSYQQPQFAPQQYQQYPGSFQQNVKYNVMPDKRSFLKWFLGYTIPSLIGILLLFYVLLAFINFYENVDPEQSPNGVPESIIFLPVGFVLLLIGAIVKYVYFYHNFDDFKKMEIGAHGLGGKGLEPGVGVFLAFIFSPLAIFFKYKQLHEHLTKSHQNETVLPASPITIILVLIFPYVLSFLTQYIRLPEFNMGLINIGSMIISIIRAAALIYFDYRWQVSLNTHIDNHLEVINELS